MIKLRTENKNLFNSSFSPKKANKKDIKFSSKKKSMFFAKREIVSKTSRGDLEMPKYFEQLLHLKMINLDLLKIDTKVPKSALFYNSLIYYSLYMSILSSRIASNPVLNLVLSLPSLLIFCLFYLKYDVLKQEALRYIVLAFILLHFFGCLIFTLIDCVGYQDFDSEFLYEIEIFLVVSSVSLLSLTIFLTVCEVFQVFEDYKMIEKGRFSRKRGGRVFAKISNSEKE